MYPAARPLHGDAIPAPARISAIHGHGLLCPRQPAGIIAMSDQIDQKRRSFLGASALGLALAPFGIRSIAHAQSPAPLPPSGKHLTGGGHTSFKSIKHVRAGLLDV